MGMGVRGCRWRSVCWVVLEFFRYTYICREEHRFLPQKYDTKICVI